MVRKVILFIFTLFFLSFISIATHAVNITETSLDEVKEITDNLKNIEKIPGVEEISLIASTIKNATETYQSVRLQIIATIDRCKKIIHSIKEYWGKIENDALLIKKYIKEKVGLISKKHTIYLFLT